MGSLRQFARLVERACAAEQPAPRMPDNMEETPSTDELPQAEAITTSSEGAALGS